MSAAQKTFYEVLGVHRNATAHEIERAYARLREEMQGESSIPDARRAAIAKVAYSTLSDPAARAEYDDQLGFKRKPVRVIDLIVWAAGALVVVGIGWWIYQWQSNRAAASAPAEIAVDVPRLLQDVGPRVGRVEAALISGEVHDLGLAVETGENEMTSVCTEMPAGTALSVHEGKTELHAELSSEKTEKGLCMLAVRGVRDGVKLRTDPPAPQERLQAVVRTSEGVVSARAVTVVGVVQTPDGNAMALKSAGILPNGTPLFDVHERLVGIVVGPQATAPEAIVALPATRIAAARGSGQQAAPAPTPAVPAAASTTAPAAAAGAEPAASTPLPSPRRRESLLAEGITTLWKEDEDNQSLVEVLDDVKKGKTGLPIAYWTKWAGDGRDHSNHCTVTLGGRVVADYEQAPTTAENPVYRYCALTRFQVELDDLQPGEYTFTIFVDGKPVAEKEVRIEKRYMTPSRWGAIVLVLGLALLTWVSNRRRARAGSQAQ